MKSYTYRVHPEKDEEVYRDIIIREDQTFEELHYAILGALELEPGEMASFYLSDQTWHKGVEITLFDMHVKDYEAVNLIMKDTLIQKIATEEISHMVYVYDFLWYKTFRVFKVAEADVNNQTLYPSCVKSVGKFVDSGEEGDVKGMPKDEEDVDSGEYSSSGYDDDSYDSEEFDNIDDLDI